MPKKKKSIENKKIKFTEREVVTCYSYEVFNGQTVHIYFNNDKFDHCSYHFSGKYNFEEWECLGEIAKEIQWLQEDHNNKAI